MGATQRTGPASSGCEGGVEDRRVSGRPGRLLGTYLHGLFENRCLRRALVDWLLERRGLPPTGEQGPELSRDAEYDRLAEALRSSLDVAALHRIIGVGG